MKILEYTIYQVKGEFTHKIPGSDAESDVISFARVFVAPNIRFAETLASEWAELITDGEIITFDVLHIARGEPVIQYVYQGGEPED